jgi:superfamily II DNA helicase RecQ
MGAHVTNDIPPKYVCDVDLLGLLRAILKKAEAVFTSPQQMELVRHVLEGTRNVVGILPTGGGKSMAWLIPAMVSDKISIVIVPNHTLLQEHIREAQERKIPTHHWITNDATVGAAKLVFIAMESVTSKRFQE